MKLLRLSDTERLRLRIKGAGYYNSKYPKGWFSNRDDATPVEDADVERIRSEHVFEIVAEEYDFIQEGLRALGNLKIRRSDNEN